MISREEGGTHLRNGFRGRMWRGGERVMLVVFKIIPVLVVFAVKVADKDGYDVIDQA